MRAALLELVLLACACLLGAQADTLVGSSCSTVTPGDHEACCKQKVADDVTDEWCQQNYSYLYQPLAGASCSTVTPGDYEACCKQKAQDGEADEWCTQNYPSVASPEFPYMAYLKTPQAPEGCAGSLIAPGYVLTAAQCVFKDGKAAEASEVSIWVGAEQYSVNTVLVNLDNAQFGEFNNPRSQPSWDIAVLELTADSNASYVALPLSDVPQLGDWVTTTAWKEPRVEVETALVPVWDGCPPGWTDDFCAGGGGFLQACPEDKGAPAIAGNVQVGLTSGPGCDGTAADYGYFIKLSDKGILEQITVWLNNGGGQGLDDNIQNWLIEANTYLYGN